MNLASSLLSAQDSGFIKAQGPELGTGTAVCLPTLPQAPLLVPSPLQQGVERKEERRADLG